MNMGAGVGGRGRYSKYAHTKLESEFLTSKTRSFDCANILSSNQRWRTVNG